MNENDWGKFVKTKCVVCEDLISPDDYETNGNFCLRCCIQAGKMAHMRRWEKEELVDNPVDTDSRGYAMMEE